MINILVNLKRKEKRVRGVDLDYMKLNLKNNIKKGDFHLKLKIMTGILVNLMVKISSIIHYRVLVMIRNNKNNYKHFQI